jgi:ribosomal protein L14E/L6E/L27E
MLRRAAVVRSAAGRDKGRLLAVVQAEKACVFVCDGKERPLSRPKRKNVRHIMPTQAALPEAAFASDRALRGALRRLEAEWNGNN